jgi:hypothetical protein
VLRVLGKVGEGLRISEDELLVGQEEHPKGAQVGTRAASRWHTCIYQSPYIPESGQSGHEGHGRSTMAKKLHDESDVRKWDTRGICWLEVGQNASDEKI